MVVRSISNTLVEEAIRHANARMQFEYDRFKLSKERRISMIVLGTIGQLVFKEYLEENQVNHDFEYQAGKYDAMDFSIKSNIVEIKTSGYDLNGYKHLNLFYAEDQLKSGLTKGFKYCVQIFVNSYSRKTKILDFKNCNTAVIAGYILFKEIKMFPGKKRFYADDYSVPIKNLKPIQSLIDNERG